MNKNYYVAIMAGGIGSRFWPMSRIGYPKQFLDILHVGQTLIQSTFERYRSFIPIENIFVVTGSEYVSLVQQQLPDLPFRNIVAEPMRKNTAPCVAYISYKILKQNATASIIIAPSDHLILNETVFKKIAINALDFVQDKNIFITLGIKPTHANTGYGYIQYESCATQQDKHPQVYKVKTFTEKPSLEIAERFIESGDFLWNAGIFVWQAKAIVVAFKHFASETYELFESVWETLNTDEEAAAMKRIYPVCKNESVDTAIMEKVDNVYVIPSVFGWSDLGTWNSAYDNFEKDSSGNALACSNIMVIDATQCVINTPADKLVVVQGLQDFIVVDTKDALLICQKSKEQNIKEYVAEIKRLYGNKYL